MPDSIDASAGADPQDSEQYPSRPNPDKHALAQIGARVRRTLDADPRAHKLDSDRAEIYAIPEFFLPEECARLVTMIDAVAQPSELLDADPLQPAFRSSSSGNFDVRDPFVQGISGKIDAILGLPRRYGEPIQGQRYRPGQEFKPHHDWFYTDQPYWRAQSKTGGQRSWTAMAFLNHVESGGQTEFANIGIGVSPHPGVLLLWNNATIDGEPNEDTLHAGCPVQSGTKYILTKWYRSRKRPLSAG